MKHSFVLLGGAVMLTLGVASCSSKPDSVAQAQDANNAKMGITNADTTVTTAKTVGGEQRPAFDSEFMTKAASGGLLEVQLGQQVAQKATTPDAKQFAQQMVTDHTKANAELKALAAQKNMTLPTTLGEDQQKVYDEVLAEKGADLDKKYVSAMLTDHQEDIKQYQEAVTKSSDADIKTYAQKQLPVLQMHLGMLQKMQPVIEAKK
jgi:putative membrane protein